jgi:hypothetical protein
MFQWGGPLECPSTHSCIIKCEGLKGPRLTPCLMWMGGRDTFSPLSILGHVVLTCILVAFVSKRFQRIRARLSPNFLHLWSTHKYHPLFFSLFLFLLPTSLLLFLGISSQNEVVACKPLIQALYFRTTRLRYCITLN